MYFSADLLCMCIWRLRSPLRVNHDRYSFHSQMEDVKMQLYALMHWPLICRWSLQAELTGDFAFIKKCKPTWKQGPWWPIRLQLLLSKAGGLIPFRNYYRILLHEPRLFHFNVQICALLCILHWKKYTFGLLKAQTKQKVSICESFHCVISQDHLKIGMKWARKQRCVCICTLSHVHYNAGYTLTDAFENNGKGDICPSLFTSPGPSMIFLSWCVHVALA